MIQILLEALIIGLKIYFASRRNPEGKEIVNAIHTQLDELQKIPSDNIDARLAVANRITIELRKL